MSEEARVIAAIALLVAGIAGPFALRWLQRRTEGRR